MLLKNAWYAAWWADDLSIDQLHPRTIADEPIVFWRDRHGSPQAILDRCPHRAAPLSLGKRIEGGVQCGYHGIAFDGAGACVLNPHGPILSALKTRSFPVAERHKLIWIWMGAEEQADTDLIPDLRCMDDAPATAFSKGFMPTAAGHLLIADNIIDLTHADYLHPTSLGGGALTRTKPTIKVNPNSTMFVEWLSSNEVPTPFFKSELADPDGAVDSWVNVLWYPNGVMILGFGATGTGRPREEGIDNWAVHIVTPETAQTTHYFFANSRNYRLEDVEYNNHYAAAMRHAFFSEDKPMLEGQQSRLGAADLFDCSPVLLASDEASTRARRILSRLVEAENAARSSMERVGVRV